jgi:hypothetical protein
VVGRLSDILKQRVIISQACNNNDIMMIKSGSNLEDISANNGVAGCW